VLLEKTDMKPSRITGVLGILLVGIGIFMMVRSTSVGGLIPILIGAALVYLALNRTRVGTLVFGHTCILAGAVMITWGILLLPYSRPNLIGIFFRPLFWGIFSLMGGICAIFHGFCHCVTKQVDQFEGNQRIPTVNRK